MSVNYFRPEDPFGAVFVFPARREHAAFFKQRACTSIHVCIQTLCDVETSQGPGKFDAELSLDGKAFNPHR